MDCKSCRMGSIKPIALMVEQVENPLGIFRRQPRFSWQIPCLLYTSDAADEL